MATAQLPDIAKIVEARIGIDAPAYGQASTVDLAAQYGALAGERWAGEVLLATLNETDGRILQAFLNTLDGRKTPFGVRMPTTLLTHYCNVSGTLAADTTRQGDTISLTATAGTRVLQGTLLSIGSIDDANYQVCEVLAEFDTGTAVSVSVAPRIRTVIASGTAVRVGNGVLGKFGLATDDMAAPAFTLDRTSPILPLTEWLG